MLVVHVHVMGKTGVIEKTYDFLRNDGKEALEGCDVVIPFDEESNRYPLTESEAIAIIMNKDLRGDH